jgi:hypothetical protein
MTDTVTLPIPYGTYGSTTAQYQLSKDGAIYTFSVGKLGNKAWRGRVWRIDPNGASASIVFEVPGSCQLFVVQGQLLCVWIDTNSGGGYNAKIKVTPIDGYIPLDSTPSGTVVDINATQVAALQQRIDVAQRNASTAQAQADKALSMATANAKAIANLNARVAKLEQQGGGGGGDGLTRQQVEDIVWSKIWDINYLIREGFRTGSSAMREVQDYIVDLASYIKRVKP